MSSDEVKANAPAIGGIPVDTNDLYAKRVQIYPREVSGTFARLRTLAVIVLLGLFYGVAWLSWDGQQLLLFDLPARQFHVFGLTFLPQDFVYLTALMIIAALALFMFTALAGRLWCGYACPQTVWTEAFMWMERRIEGDRARRMKLDAQPMSGRKLRLKVLKHGVWVAFSLWTGFTFVGYFTPITELGARFFSFDWGAWEIFWVFFYAFATYGNAGWMREQVCTYMCPYARFQSAMFDRSTLVIAYDEQRGEPRGSRRRGTDGAASGLGDCINCTLCVQVCPTGIDIRNGLQYQCIACAACIDACDGVMDRMGSPRGLIRYTSQHAMDGEPVHIWRPRIFIYIGLLAALTTALVLAIVLRVPVELDVIRDRMALYRDVAGGRVENVYSLRLINKTGEDQRFEIGVSGLAGIELLVTEAVTPVPAGGVTNVPVRVRADRAGLDGVSSGIVFTMTSPDDPALSTEAEARFLGPRPGR